MEPQRLPAGRLPCSLIIHSQVAAEALLDGIHERQGVGHRAAWLVRLPAHGDVEGCHGMAQHGVVRHRPAWQGSVGLNVVGDGHLMASEQVQISATYGLGRVLPEGWRACRRIWLARRRIIL